VLYGDTTTCKQVRFDLALAALCCGEAPLPADTVSTWLHEAE